MEPETTEFFSKLRESDPENQKCFDCGVSSPQWASVSHGVLICLMCSGIHRGLGVNISVVRSISLDSWSPTQKAMMSCGGNGRCRAYFDEQKITNLPIMEKYKTRAAAHYRATIKAYAENRERPAPLPEGVGALREAEGEPRPLPDETSFRGMTGLTDTNGFSSSSGTWGTFATPLSGLWGRAASVAQSAANIVAEGEVLSTLKTAASAAGDWVGDTGRTITATVQDKEFWNHAQQKASEGVHSVTDAFHSMTSQAETWISTAMGEQTHHQTTRSPSVPTYSPGAPSADIADMTSSSSSTFN